MNNILIDIRAVIDQLDDDAHIIEMTTEGEWFEKNGSIFMVYYESEISGMEGCKTMLKIHGNTVTMTRYGETNSKMVFQVDHPMVSMYKTPYGNFEMHVETKVMDIALEDRSGKLHIEYHMTLENLSSSINELTIIVRPQDADY